MTFAPVKKYPFPLNAIRAAFPIVETIAPALAQKWAAQLFITPHRFGFTDPEKVFLKKLEQFHFKAGGKQVVGYRLGTGPAVICVHGWAGRAVQFRMLAEALVKRGYSFVAFDAWGHGQSEGKQSQLFEFSAAVEALYKQTENPIALVGHSLGVASIAWAAKEGLAIPALVSVAAPVIAQDILDDFCRIINASRKVQAGIRERAVISFNIQFDDAVLEATFSEIRCPVFAIHGETDKDVPLSHLDVLASIRPEIDTKVIPGVGHRGILKSQLAIDQVIDWIEGVNSSVDQKHDSVQ